MRRTPPPIVALLASLLGLPACGAAAGDEPLSGPPPAAASGPFRCSGKAAAKGDVSLKLSSGGQDRTAELHLPKDYDPATGAPLVVVFHFAHGSPKLMALSTSMNDAADKRGFLVAYPAAAGDGWNAGKCCGEAWKKGLDDVRFTRELLDAIEKEYCVDPRRVFAAGMSNGALMTERLGVEMADRFAAIAPVAGVLHLATPWAPRRQAARPVSVLEIHGTADVWIPYDGGHGNPLLPVEGDLEFSSVPEDVATWRTADGCSQASKPTYEKGDARCVAWSGCGGGASVELCTIEGGGHTWPGGHMPILFGKTSTDLDASGAILDFFVAHPRT